MSDTDVSGVRPHSRVPGLRGVLKVDIIESPSWGGGVVDEVTWRRCFLVSDASSTTRVRFRMTDFGFQPIG